jgi:hypothetical protein
MGMGFLHAGIANSLTEETVITDEHLEKKEISLDYHAGRMMKTQFKVSDDGSLSVSPNEPRFDYQSWASVYPSGKDLINAVEQSFA